jgi:predicted nucleic acid-binding protein
MNVLFDTNILLRLAQPGHPHHPVAVAASASLYARGDTPCLVPQVLYEYWVVSTRPIAQSGMGLSAIQAASELTRLQSLFPLLPDTSSLFGEWERLVTRYQVLGKNAHDTRLVAAMLVHGVSHILTFNRADFARFTGIVILDPGVVVSPAAP